MFPNPHEVSLLHEFRLARFVMLTAVLLWGCSGNESTPPTGEEGPPLPQSENAERPRLSWLELGENAPEERLLHGFYPPEPSWRWTARVFAVSLDPLETRESFYLELNFALAEVLIDQLAPLTLTARVNGMDIGSETYKDHGTYTFLKPVPVASLKADPAIVAFEMDKAARQGQGYNELGLIAVSLGFKEFEETEEFREQQIQRAKEGYVEILRKRDLKMSSEKQKELMKLFHELEIWKNLYFQGVEIIKNPLDLWMMQQIIYELQPDYIVETGTMRGGSALYWAQTLQGFGLENSRVLTVDISDQTEDVNTHPLWKKYVQFFHGGSTDPRIVRQIKETVEGKTVLVTLDSDHHMNHVLNELRLYAPLVSPGSYIVVEDTHFDAIPTFSEQGAGPMAAVNVFLQEDLGKQFEQHLAREALVMTFNPGGWLRKKH